MNSNKDLNFVNRETMRQKIKYIRKYWKNSQNSAVAPLLPNNSNHKTNNKNEKPSSSRKWDLYSRKQLRKHEAATQRNPTSQNKN